MDSGASPNAKDDGPEEDARWTHRQDAKANRGCHAAKGFQHGVIARLASLRLGKQTTGLRVDHRCQRRHQSGVRYYEATMKSRSVPYGPANPHRFCIGLDRSNTTRINFARLGTGSDAAMKSRDKPRAESGSEERSPSLYLRHVRIFPFSFCHRPQIPWPDEAQDRASCDPPRS